MPEMKNPSTYSIFWSLIGSNNGIWRSGMNSNKEKDEWMDIKTGDEDRWGLIPSLDIDEAWIKTLRRRPNPKPWMDDARFREWIWKTAFLSFLKGNRTYLSFWIQNQNDQISETEKKINLSIGQKQGWNSYRRSVQVIIKPTLVFWY